MCENSSIAEKNILSHLYLALLFMFKSSVKSKVAGGSELLRYLHSLYNYYISASKYITFSLKPAPYITKYFKKIQQSLTV